MSNIDERIVEMQFRRDDFLKGTADTLGALERLENALLGSGGIGRGVQQISSAFSVFGAIGAGALLKLGSSAVEAGAKIVNNVMEPIFGGGKRRAINLEQADFMLNNIFKDAGKVAAVMDNVSYAVDGTAYGLDAAAIAAAQFAASGYESGDVMKTALRGISGVAAMTSASYEDISSVFTKVAGQGRLMGDDLNRLSARGINAAATMVDYYKETGKFANITETDLRDMVSKGKISFEDFAAAMDGTFGEDATKANEIYTGSLSNIKAALARIGAPAFTIEHEKMRRIFNALRPVINAFQKGLKILYSRYEQFIAIPIAKKFEEWGAALEKLDWGKVGVTLSQFIIIAANFRDVIGSWIKPLTDAFAIVFAPSQGGGWLEGISLFLDSFNRGLLGLKATEGQQASLTGFFVSALNAAKDFGRFVEGVFSKLGPIAGAVFDIFMTGVGYVVSGFEYLAPIVMGFFDDMVGKESVLRAFFDGFMASVEETGSVFETLGIYILAFYEDYIVPFIESLDLMKDAIMSIGDDGFEGFRGKLEAAFDPLREASGWFDTAWEGIKNFFGRIQEGFDWVRNNVPIVGDVISTFFENLFASFKGVGSIDGASEMQVFGELGGLLGALLDIITNFLDGVTVDDILKVAGAIVKLVAAIKTVQLIDSARGVFDSITGFFGEGALLLKRTNVETFNDKLRKFAISIAILAGAVFLLSSIDPDKLLLALFAVGALAAIIVALQFAMSKIEATALTASAGGILLLAIAVGFLAGALFLMSLIDTEDLIKGGTAVIAMLAALTIAGILLGPAAPGLLAGGFGILLIAAALTLLIIPIKALGEMDKDELEQGMYNVAAALGMLVIAAILIGAVAPQMIAGGLGLLLIVAALTLMIVPLRAIEALDGEKMRDNLILVGVALAALVLAALAMNWLGAGALGVLVIAAALVVLAIGIQKLADVDYEDGINGLKLLAGALAILVGAAVGANFVLPGVLGLAALVLAFGIAAAFTGWGTKKMADGVEKLADELPNLIEALVLFAYEKDKLEEAIPVMTDMAGAVFKFGMAALAATPGAWGLGFGLLALGWGLKAIKEHGVAGAETLHEVIEVLEPLLLKTIQIGALVLVLTGLGIALGVFGIGALLAGIGGAVFGVGITIAAIGLGLFMVVAWGVSFLIPTIVEQFKKLGELYDPLMRFSDAMLSINGAFVNFTDAANDAYRALSDLLEVFMSLNDFTSVIGDSMQSAADKFCEALAKMVACATEAPARIAEGVEKIESSLSDLSSGIAIAEGPVVASVDNMMTSMVTSLNTGSVQITSANTTIVSTFVMMAAQLAMAGALSVQATQQMATKLAVTLIIGAGQIARGVALSIAAFSRLAPGISQNGSNASGAASKVVNGVAVALIVGSGRLYSLAYSAGGTVGAGMAAGIRASAGRAASAAAAMGAAAIASARRAIDARSPSRAFAKLGNWAVDGFLLPFLNRTGEAEKTSASMAQSTLDAFNEIVSRLDGEFDDLDGFNPTITPVLDLDGVRRQARGINGLFGESFDADFGQAKAGSIAVLEEALRDLAVSAPEKVEKKYEFTQINQSPKALDAGEIYRGSKNLISMAERKDM